MRQSQREEFLAGASPGPGIRGSLWTLRALNNLEFKGKEPEN